jgi:hypothetical protein
MKRFKWTIEISVDESWVADGLDLQDGQDLADRLRHGILTFAPLSDMEAKVIKGPAREAIAKVQGFKSVADMDECNRRLL